MIRQLKKIKNKFEARIGLVLPKTKTSNPISKFFRPVFEHKMAQQILGVPLVALTVLGGASQVSLAAAGVVPLTMAESQKAMVEINVPIETEESVKYPVAEAIGVSQGYNVFHNGIDIRAHVGAEITPVAAGVVTGVFYEKYGYGNYVEIDHKNGYTSLYAHMSEAIVNVGDEVNTNTVIGFVGLTGRTTGPHLHLEIRKDGRTINPFSFLR